MTKCKRNPNIEIQFVEEEGKFTPEKISNLNTVEHPYELHVRRVAVGKIPLRHRGTYGSTADHIKTIEPKVELVDGDGPLR